MTTSQFLLIAYGVVIIGLLLPLRSELRSGLVVLLIIMVVFTLLGGGMHYFRSLFD